MAVLCSDCFWRQLFLLLLRTTGTWRRLTPTAMGTSTQMGHTVGIKVTIFRYSTDDDRQILVKAFTAGQQQGLVKALSQYEAGWAHRHHGHAGVRPRLRSG